MKNSQYKLLARFYPYRKEWDWFVLNNRDVFDNLINKIEISGKKVLIKNNKLIGKKYSIRGNVKNVNDE